MLLKVDFSQELWRLLYAQLYERVLTFALECGDSETLVKSRFTALVANDPSVSLLVNLDESGNITAHCLFLVQQLQPAFGIFVEQLQVDSKHDEEFVKACIVYAESIPTITRISMVTDEKKYKAFRKKYEFEVSKVLMIRDIKKD